MTASPESGGRWYYVHEGRRKGPVDNAQLVDLILEGEIPEDCLIWRQGLDKWAPASEVDEIKRELPPPIPVPDGPAAGGDGPGDAEVLAASLLGEAAVDGSAQPGGRRRRRHRTRYRIAPSRPRWLLPLIVMVLVVIVVLWYLLRRVNEVPQGRIILEGAVFDDTSAPSRRLPASPGWRARDRGTADPPTAPTARRTSP
jgi:uncharacterized protein DUF4339